MHNNYFLCKGKTLLICLLSLWGASGAYSQISFCPPTTPGFEECEIIDCTMCNLNGVTGTTAGYGDDPDGDLNGVFCGTVESVQYFEFYAAVANLAITVTVSNCSVISGIDLAMEPLCDTPLEACVAGNGTNSTTLFLGGLTVGETYILIIDVDASSVCDFKISVSPPNGTTPIIPASIHIEGDFAVCPNATTEYQVVPGLLFADYIWTVSAGAEIVGYAQQNSVATVHWGDTGGEVCVTVTNPCNLESTTLCHAATVTPIPPTILPPVTICAEDAPFELAWNAFAYSSGTYSYTTNTSQGCDSTTVQTLTVLQPNFHTLPPFVMCEGGCQTVCGEMFCGYGTYSAECQSVAGCDSVVNFSIVPPNLVADIIGGGSITCVNSTVTLTAAPTSGIKTWYNSAGQQIGSGGLLTVTSPGTYILSVTFIAGGEECTQVDSIFIPMNISPPGVTGMGAMIGCDTVPVMVRATTPVNPALFSWSGPNGFMSNVQNPQVTDIGTYIVTVTNPLNGCVSKDTVIVKQCCHTFSGTLDSVLLTACANKDILAGFYGNQTLAPGDTLVFILYSNPADPLGSILMVLPTPVFPFVGGVVQTDSVYYVAALATSVLLDSTVNFHGVCLSLSSNQPVMWIPKPTIAVPAPPKAVCKGDCVEITFEFTGTPPFQYHLEIGQNGVLLYSQMDMSDTLQKTVTICPTDLSQPLGPGSINVGVNFLQDARCGCFD